MKGENPIICRTCFVNYDVTYKLAVWMDMSIFCKNTSRRRDGRRGGGGFVEKLSEHDSNL